ncbi:TetR/AcrR family transcriptional regulator [Blastococcus saxobsidens]|uniref:TetR/AcrR family transcriptional regulator n=1 Tax=Blastococcus saxobsidens TaxID=138336 RepID=UPI001E4C7A18|nr:TetR/AcrR family transcriptional regulator [Blastococcus saxobsidens]
MAPPVTRAAPPPPVPLPVHREPRRDEEPGAADSPAPGARPTGRAEAPVADGVTEGDAAGPGRGRRARRGSGIRERRRQQTRDRIVDAASDLFTERGFDAVSVVEIAQRAGVVEKTVFNHFPVKEGLVFEADPPMRAALLDAVRRRPAGESVSAAAGSFVVGAVSLLGSPAAADGVAAMAQVIRGSRTLQIREREILGELTGSLAELIAEETGAQPGQIEPWLAAHAVLGLYASLLELARDRVLAGVSGPELSAELRRQGRRGLALLQFGLAGYAKKR